MQYLEDVENEFNFMFDCKLYNYLRILLNKQKAEVFWTDDGQKLDGYLRLKYSGVPIIFLKPGTEDNHSFLCKSFFFFFKCLAHLT